MYRVDNATSTGSIPTPGPVGPNPDSYFADGTTVVPADFLNAVQEELAYVIDTSPTSPALSKTDRTQVYTAIMDILNNGTYGALNYNNLLYIEDQKTSGTAGGNSTGSTQNVRALNTKVIDNIAGASLSANQVTLPAGTYWIEASCPVGWNAGSYSHYHKCRLRNITDSSTALVGTSQYDNSGGSSRTILKGSVIIAGAKAFELQHYTSTAVSLGSPTTTGDIEVYSEVKIWKVA